MTLNEPNVMFKLLLFALILLLHSLLDRAFITS